MVSLSSHSSLPLTQYPIDTNAVSWSVDDRIAVSSQEIIKVFSLRRRTSHTSQEPSKLLAAISSIKLPKFSKPSPAVDLRPLLACYDTIDHSLFLDPAMGFCDVPSDGFIQTKWSPSGLGPTGRCLLTCLTRYGSLLIYAPPTSLEITWKMVCSVSEEYRNLLKTTDYDISSITDVQSMNNQQLPSTSAPSTSAPSTSVPSTSVPSTSVPSTSVPSTSVPSTSVPSTSVPSTSVPSTSVPSTSVPSTSSPSTSSPSASVPLTNDVNGPSTNSDSTGGNKKQIANISSDIKKTIQQKLLATITSFSWLPVPMVTEPNGTCCLLLAVAVKARYVILFSFNLNSLGTHFLSPISIHNLVEDGSNMSVSYWPCALNFITINNVCLLVVSFTNGTLKYLRWDNPGPKPHLDYFTVPCPLNTLWPFADEVPVNLLTHMLNQNGGSNSSVWCIFTKCSHLVIVPINLSTQEITSYGFISGCHNSTITGLTLLSNSILTCSRDGRIQTTCIPAGSLSGDSHVTIDGYHVTDLSSCAMEVPQSGSFKFPHGYNGMVASQNGLFIALGISFSSYNKLATPSEIQLLSVDNSEVCPFPLPLDYNMRWDSYEYHRFNQLFLNLDISCSDLRLQLYNQQLNDDESLLDVAIIVKFVEDMLENLESNEFTLSKQCKLSISNFYTLLRHHENTSNRVRDPTHSFYCTQIPQWSAVEYCGICNEVIPYSCCRGDSCSQGHYWKRCVLTQCLITLPFEGVCCSLCESHAYSIKSSSIEEGTWLSWLLRNNRRCPLCGGFFDLFLNTCN